MDQQQQQLGENGLEASFDDEAFGGMFGFDANEAENITTDESDTYEGNPDFYRPSILHKKAVNKTYSSRVRIVPNLLDNSDNPNKHRVSKWIYYLPDPNDADKKFYLDCPSLGGLKKNIVSEAFFALREHEYQVYRQIANDHFKRKKYHWSLVYIMMDHQEPEIEGKIKILRYGKTIHEMVTKEAASDPTVGRLPVIVYHPFKGKDLILHINEKEFDNRKMTNYGDSMFDNQISSFSFDKGQTRMPMTKEAAEQVRDFIMKESPDLSQVYYEHWDAQLEEKTIAAVRALVQDQMVFDSIMAKAYPGGKVNQNNHYQEGGFSQVQAGNGQQQAQHAAPQGNVQGIQGNGQIPGGNGHNPSPQGNVQGIQNPNGNGSVQSQPTHGNAAGAPQANQHQPTTGQPAQGNVPGIQGNGHALNDQGHSTPPQGAGQQDQISQNGNGQPPVQQKAVNDIDNEVDNIKAGLSQQPTDDATPQQEPSQGSVNESIENIDFSSLDEA